MVAGFKGRWVDEIAKLMVILMVGGRVMIETWLHVSPSFWIALDHRSSVHRGFVVLIEGTKLAMIILEDRVLIRVVLSVELIVVWHYLAVVI